jgi:polyisoprenoid-binding protein YceI
MTNYIAAVAAALSLASTCHGADAPVAASLPHYLQAPAGSSLTFSFSQAGADNSGSFKQFATDLTYDEKSLAASKLRVKVQIASLDTQDKDRDTTLAGTDLFDTQKFPLAQFVATSFAKRAGGGIEAVGKLTVRGVTKDLRLPITLRATTAGLELSGEVSLKRLDYGVGQGEWKSTEWVGDDVKLQYKVALVKAPAAAAR